MDEDSQLLIDALLSNMKFNDEIETELDDDFDTTEKKDTQEQPESSTKETSEEKNKSESDSEEDVDWDNLSEPELEDVTTKATEQMPSFQELIAEDLEIEFIAIFEKQFPIGRKFIDKEDARKVIQDFSRAKNVPFETSHSNASTLKMVCKHFGKYRAAKGGKSVSFVFYGNLKRKL